MCFFDCLIFKDGHRHAKVVVYLRPVTFIFIQSDIAQAQEGQESSKRMPEKCKPFKDRENVLLWRLTNIELVKITPP